MRLVSNRPCAHFNECTRTRFDGFGDRKRKCLPKCFKSCPDFREASCSRGIHVWFADPYCSPQKPHIERSHNELRRILQKETSFDPLTQEKINPTLVHINSYPREATGWEVPYDLFVKKYGDEWKSFLDKLGSVRIPSNHMTLHAFLLGEKYQKAADKAILKKNGVVPTTKPTPEK